MKFFLSIFIALSSCTTPQPKIEGDNGNNIPPIVVPPKPPKGFILIGDTGTGEQAQYEVADGIEKFCAQRSCEAALLLGDNIYEDGVESVKDKQWEVKFELPYQPLSIPFYAVLGNHDYRGDYRAQIQYRSKKWRMLGRYYKLQFTDIDIFGIDSNTFSLFKRDSAQLDWLKDELKNSKAKWKVVFGHHPIYSYGLHGDQAGLKRDIEPLLQKYGVDFYVAGHDHHKQLIERDKIAYVISGAGAKLRSSKGGKYSKYNKSTLGFAYLTIDGDKARLEFVDANGNVEYLMDYAK